MPGKYIRLTTVIGSQKELDEGEGRGRVGGGAEMHRGGREVFDYLGEQVVQGLVYTSRSPS